MIPSRKLPRPNPVRRSDPSAAITLAALTARGTRGAHTGPGPVASTARTALAALAAVAALCQVTPASADSTSGSWSADFDWPFNAIHLALGRDSRVLAFGGNGTGGQGALSYLVWDPSLGTGAGSFTEFRNETRSNLFCAAQVVDPTDGELLTFGGAPTFGERQVNSLMTRYDSASSGIQQFGPRMKSPRWYSTATTLAHGDILLQGGIPQCCPGQPPQITPELYERERGFRSLFGATSREAYGRHPEGLEFYNKPATEERWWYPRSYVTPKGKVLGVSSSTLFLMDPSGDGRQTYRTKYPAYSMGATSSGVMYQPGKILQMGGGLHSSDTRGVKGARAATLIDATVEPPRVRPTQPMAFGRHWHTSTLLADGSVLVTGGSLENNTLTGVANRAELWNPVTERWKTLAEGKHARLYHSTAMLLPDGSVLVAGGGAPGPVNNKNGEVFYPPYLYSGGSRRAQSTWSRAPASTSYGRTIEARLSSARKISRVTFVKTGAVTHSFNNDQRFIELAFSQRGDLLSIDTPPSALLATPGNWMLFAIDDRGAPSKGAVMSLNTTNLAKGRQAKQSSEYYYSRFPATRATDGNIKGNDGRNEITHTRLENQPWLDVDLGARRQIDTIRIWNREGIYGERLKDFRVLVSDRPFPAGRLALAEAGSGVSSYAFPGTATRSEFLNIGRQGRHVRVQLAGRGYLQLAELEVLGGPARSLRNLSPQRPTGRRNRDTYTLFPVTAQGDYRSGERNVADRRIRPDSRRVVGLSASDRAGYFWMLRDDRLSTGIGRDTYTLVEVDAAGNGSGREIRVDNPDIVPSKQVMTGLAFDGDVFWMLRDDLLSYGKNRWIVQAVNQQGRYARREFAVDNADIVPTRQLLTGLAWDASSQNFWLLRDDLESYGRDRWIVQAIDLQGRYARREFALTDRNMTATDQLLTGLARHADGRFELLRDNRFNDF